MKTINIKDFKALVEDKKIDWLTSFIDKNFPEVLPEERFGLMADILLAIENCQKEYLTSAVLRRLRNKSTKNKIDSTNSRETLYADFSNFSSDDENAEEDLITQEDQKVFYLKQSEFEREASSKLSPVLFETFQRFTNPEAEIKLTAGFGEESLKILFRQAFLRLKWKD